MPTTRRDFLAGAGAAALARPAAGAPAPAPGDAAARRLLDATAEMLLADHPESALGLGIDRGARAALRTRLTDRSAAAVRARAARAAQQAGALRRLDRAALSPATALDVEVVEAAFALAEQGRATMPVGDVAVLDANNSYRSTPYTVAQNTGAFVELPDLLESKHQVAGADDAEAYLLRLDAYAAALDGETGRIGADTAAGAILPGFLLDLTIHQLQAAHDQPVAAWPVVAGFAAKCAAARLPIRFAQAAEERCAARVRPALARQIAALAAARPRAGDAPGIWHMPHGDDYYRWLVRAGTTTDASPDELHRLGLEQNRALTDRIDGLLRAQGLTGGTVAERLGLLARRPDQLFGDDDAGRAKLLRYLAGRIADMRTRLPRAFHTPTRGDLVIKRVPPAIQDGAPNGYAGPGSIDGTLPGEYYINLKDTGIWPRWSLPTLCYHEGLPGHVWQGEYQYRLPLVRTLLAFNAFSEGWALYAEQLGDELGAYDDDPLGRIGYLQSISFRACRLVVDTGLHQRRWGFDQALDWFAGGTGQPRAQLRAELNRYCAWPGQACGYKMGHNAINGARDAARRRLGARFDLAAFDDAVVLGGNMPLDLLGRTLAGRLTPA